MIISSLGYQSDTIDVRTLIKKGGKVALKPNIVQLDEVKVVEYASARKLLEAVVERILQNYRMEEAIGIWHYRNRQMLNDRLFVKSEGLIRNYMPAYGTMLSLGLYYGQDSSEWNEELYRLYQRLDTVMVFDKPNAEDKFLHWELKFKRKDNTPDRCKNTKRVTFGLWVILQARTWL